MDGVGDRVGDCVGLDIDGDTVGDTEGADVAGEPVGDVVGRYTVDGDTLTIHIDRKPRLAPSGVVRNIVTHFFDNLDT